MIEKSNLQNKSDVHQDLFAYLVNNISYPQNSTNNKKFWIDIGARNFGSGFGQNNTVFLYENGWSGLSLDIGDYSNDYKSLDPHRVVFKNMDCTDSELLLTTLKENNVPQRINYLSFDIDESTIPGMDALKHAIDSEGYIFDSITIEHDSYRFGTSTRDKQREFFSNLDYIMVVEVDLYEDWWVHKSIYNSKYDILKEISNIKHHGGFDEEDKAQIKNILLSLL
jgi:hypothetical protein